MTEPYRGAQGSGSQGSIVTERSWVSSHGFHDDRSPGGADPPLSRGGGPVAEINFEFVRAGRGRGRRKICTSVVRREETAGDRWKSWLPPRRFRGDRDREKSGKGKAIDFDQASPTTCHSISIPDEIPDLTVAGYATPTGIMDEGLRWNVQLRMTGDSFFFFFSFFAFFFLNVPRLSIRDGQTEDLFRLFSWLEFSIVFGVHFKYLQFFSPLKR